MTSVRAAHCGLAGAITGPFQRAAAFGAGGASAGAVGAAGDAGLPVPRAVGAPPPDLLVAARGEPVGVEGAVAGWVQLGGQVRAQYGERPFARHWSPSAAAGAALPVLRGCLPFVAAGRAAPPDGLHGP